MRFDFRIMRIARQFAWTGALFFVVSTSAASADLVPTGWVRPTNDTEASDTLTTYQHWDNLGTTGQPTNVGIVPDIAEINPNGFATVIDSASPGSGSFFTSGGNIYSFSGVIKPEVALPGFATGNLVNFWVQLTTQGSDIDVNDFTLGGTLVNTLSNYNYTEVSRVPLGGFGGAKVEHLWEFTAPSDLASFDLGWGWGVTSSSLDILIIDTQVVPEPSSLLAFGMVGVGLLLRRRRK